MYGTPINFNKLAEYGRKVSDILDSMEIPYDRMGIVEDNWGYDFLIADWLILLFGYRNDLFIIYKIARLREMQYGVICLEPEKADEWETIIRQQYKEGRYDPSKLEV